MSNLPASRSTRRPLRIQAEIDECEDILDLVRNRNPGLASGEQVRLACAVIKSIALADLADSIAGNAQSVVNNIVDVETAVQDIDRRLKTMDR